MPHPKVKISDDSGNTVGITSNRLDVNVAGATMSTGDIEVNSEFPAAATIADNFANPSTTSVMSMLMGYDGAAWDRLLIGGGTEAAALRVTLANDSTGVISVDDGGNVITVDGTVDLGSTATNHLSEIEGAVESLENIITVIGLSTYADGVTKGIPAAAVRNNVLEDLTGADNTLAPLQVNAIGGLYITGSEVENAGVQSEPLLMGGRYDASSRSLGSGDAGAVALNASGHVIVDGSGVTQPVSGTLTVNSHAVTNAGTFAVQSTLQANSGVDIGDVDIPNLLVREDLAHVSAEYGVTAMTVRNDVLAALTSHDGDNATLQVDAQGALYTTHGITGMVSDMDADVGTTAEKIHTAADVAIKRIDIQASTTNTGYIYVGDSGVAGNGTGGGIKLAAGDFYSLDIDNTGDVYVAASVADEDVSYIYYT